MLRELQLEGLVGPTHHYAGLGLGNRASQRNEGEISNPRKAALQSLDLMQWLHARGVPLAIMPPQARPRLDVLRALGFSGSIGDQLQQAQQQAPSLLRALWSASSMWVANAATVTPACDARDLRTHITPANLMTSLHRMLEARETEHYLRQIFGNAAYFTVHPPLPVTSRLADEGAANHMRLCDNKSTEAVHVFIYGAKPPASTFPSRFMPRQQYEASVYVAENHQLTLENCLFFQQSPEAIDAGVFHHDVIGLSHERLFVCHEKAFVDQKNVLSELASKAPWLDIRVISDTDLPLAQAVESYFFNAQLVSLPQEQDIAILFPQECAENKHAQRQMAVLQSHPFIAETACFDLRESMRNGGGPACLRLRVPLSEEALGQVHRGVRYTPELASRLRDFIGTHYRDRLSHDDLLDAAFVSEVWHVQRELLNLLGLLPLYRFEA